MSGWIGTKQEEDKSKPISTLEKLNKPNSINPGSRESTSGRQRLHGAFQGGFSAGFYNTVGSKEGFFHFLSYLRLGTYAIQIGSPG
jgi:hypothetical protein